jgi:hypothetical protein
MHRRPRSAWAGACVLILGVLTACGQPPAESAPASPSASVAGEPSLEPSASGDTEPTTSEAPADPGVSEGQLVQVLADDLRIRSEPGTASEQVATMERGTVVRVVSGPADADGFTWYEVVDTMDQAGWAADGDASDAWLARIEPIGSAEPLLTFQYGCDVTGPIPHPATVVLDDGRVIVAEHGLEVGWTIRRLSEAGMAEVRENILGSPYLQASARYNPELRADAGDPPGHGACLWTFTVATEGEPIVVESVSWFGDEEEAAFYEPSPERKALNGIAENLRLIDEVLDEDDWEAAGALRYVAPDYVLWLASVEPGPGPDFSTPINGTLPIGDIAEFGMPAGTGRCDVVSQDVAFEIARLLDPVSDTRRALHVLTLSSYRTDTETFTLAMVPRTPDGAPDCDGINL